MGKKQKVSSNDVMLRIEQVMDRLQIGRDTIYRGIRAGTFPQPLKVGPRASAWLSSDIDLWIEGLKKKRAKTKW